VIVDAKRQQVRQTVVLNSDRNMEKADSRGIYEESENAKRKGKLEKW